MKRLENKRCLITGAARGIGEAIAASFLREGAQVILSDIDFDAVQQTAQKLGGTLMSSMWRRSPIGSAPRWTIPTWMSW